LDKKSADVHESEGLFRSVAGEYRAVTTLPLIAEETGGHLAPVIVYKIFRK